MDINNINPVSRTQLLTLVRRESQSNHRQRFAPRLEDDDPETERIAESGMGRLDDDDYALANDSDSAILAEIKAETLRGPATVATQVLQRTERNNGNHG